MRAFGLQSGFCRQVSAQVVPASQETKHCVAVDQDREASLDSQPMSGAF